jgi:hypothetical protein
VREERTEEVEMTGDEKEKLLSCALGNRRRLELLLRLAAASMRMQKN